MWYTVVLWVKVVFHSNHLPCCLAVLTRYFAAALCGTCGQRKGDGRIEHGFFLFKLQLTNDTLFLIVHWTVSIIWPLPFRRGMRSMVFWVHRRGEKFGIIGL